VGTVQAAPVQPEAVQGVADGPVTLDGLLAGMTNSPMPPPPITVVSGESGPVVVTAPDPSQQLVASDHLVRRLDELTDAVGELTAAQANAIDLTDPDSIEIFTNGLYRRIRDSLRQELLVDRERAGILSDLR
jgi:hypothetical protein